MDPELRELPEHRDGEILGAAAFGDVVALEFALCGQALGIVNPLLSARRTAVDLMAYDHRPIMEYDARQEDVSVRIRYHLTSPCRDPEAAP